VINKDLIINVTSSEIVIALLEDKQLVELSEEKSNPDFIGAVGDIYLGRVRKLMPGLNAAFVDVGYEKDAFLHYLDLGPQFSSLSAYLLHALQGKQITPLQDFKLSPDIDKNGKIADVLKSGQKVLVQIAKEPISTKGPRLTSEISIAGRNIVLVPFSDKVSVSQKIKSNEEKTRLKKLILSIKPNNYGVIIRTVAEGKKAALLDAELRSLLDKWENAFLNIKNFNVPKRIIGEINRTSAILRDILNSQFNSIIVNDEQVFEDIKDYITTIAPEKEKIVKLYNGRTPLFEHLNIDKQIRGLFGKTVTMRNGAYLIIEHTEALHVIDVNSGNRSKKSPNQESNALEVNLSAAEEIARQLRLRDMGGIIVIDFIDMHSPENKQTVYEKLKSAMASDRTKHNILPLSKFGLMQITRQRVRPEMAIKTKETCPTCKGSGEIAPSMPLVEMIENNLRYALTLKDLGRVTLKVHPFVAAFLNQGAYSIKLKWWIKYKVRIKVVAVPEYTIHEFNYYDKEDNLLTSSL